MVNSSVELIDRYIELLRKKKDGSMIRVEKIELEQLCMLLFHTDDYLPLIEDHIRSV